MTCKGDYGYLQSGLRSVRITNMGGRGSYSTGLLLKFQYVTYNPHKMQLHFFSSSFSHYWSADKILLFIRSFSFPLQNTF